MQGAFQGKVVWITGASSGIGEALTYQFVAEGATVIASARREAELLRVKAACGVAAERVIVQPLDLTEIDTFPAVTARLIDQLGHIDVLVNNAGFSQRALTRETDFLVDRKVMEVNFFGQVALTKAVLPYMLQQSGGHFVVMSSLTGKFGYPMRSAYAASKHALQGFFETLYLEEYAHGIRVTIANPGGIQTNISVNAITGDGGKHGKMDELQSDGLPAEVCARQIVGAVKAERFELVIGNFREKMSVRLKRLLPKLLHRIIWKNLRSTTS